MTRIPFGGGSVMASEKESASKLSTTTKNLLKSIPKVDEFLGWVGGVTDTPTTMVKSSVRELLDNVREAILSGQPVKKMELTREALLPKFKAHLNQKMTLNFRTVINGTGVVVHTNLGRSLLPNSAMDMITQVGARYSNLEFDLNTGKRGSRYSLVEDLLCELTGAEAALVVNNNAAAVLLVLETLAAGQEVIVSRGQLVEIGGSFRIPDVMAKSGAKMVEVGATNRTHLRDYENAITDETSMLLKVHSSNFRMVGFTSEVDLPDLVSLASKKRLVVMDDLGSGSLVDLSGFGLQKEPTVSEAVKAGVDVITFSGDKLLGGPQAGLIVGKRKIIEKIKKNPMNRALRIDKFTLAGLEAVLRLYFDEEAAIKTIPTLAMLTMPSEEIKKKANRLLRRIKKDLEGKCNVSLMQTESQVGGGAMPEHGLATWAVTLAPLNQTVNELENNLRAAELPVIGRIEDDKFLLDMRTVADDEIPALTKCLIQAFEKEEEENV